MASVIRNNLLRLTARTGKLVDSRGDIINQADQLRESTDRDISQASRDGKLYRAYWVGTIPTGATYDLVIDIPAGREIYGITRDQVLGSGSVDIKFLVGGTYTTLVESQVGKNFDELLEDQSVCSFARATDLTGASERAFAFHESPTQNPRATSSTQTEAGAHPRFNSQFFPVFEYTNVGASAIRIAVNLIWQEIPVT